MVEVTVEGPYSIQLQQHLRSVLEAHTKGLGSNDYRGLLNELIQLKYRAFGQTQEGAEYDICNLLDLLTGCISSVHQSKHGELITEVYTIPLWQCHQELRRSVLGFLLHLAVVNPTTTHQTLQNLVMALSLPFALAREYQDSVDSDWVPSDLVKAIHEDIVAVLAKMLELIPVAGALLGPVLARAIPNKFIAKNVLCTYLHGLFKIAELPMAGSIKDTVLSSIVEHLLSLDVEILWQDISWSPEKEEEAEGKDDGAGSDEEPDMFELEGNKVDVELDPAKFEEDEQLEAADLQQGDIAEQRVSGRGGFEGQAQDAQPSTSGRSEVDEGADKLDCMMCLVFQHLENRIAAGEFNQAWKSLLDVFFLSILNTHRSKFTQYLLWVFLMKEPEHASKQYIKGLLSVLSDPRQADINRSAAAAYLSSYLARSAFIPNTLLVEAIQKLASWCLQFCKGQGELHAANAGFAGHQGISATPIPPSVIYQVFYAACQGLLYVLCYRLEQLVRSPEGGRSSHTDAIATLVRDVIPQLLNSRLAPLTVCLPTVVNEFARLSSRLGLVETDSLPKITESRRCERPLEMFFPFDPYLLRHSSRFLKLDQSFVRWKGGHSTADQAGQGADSEDEDGINGASASDSESSGLDSHEGDSDDEANQLADEFQGLTPNNEVTVGQMGMMINGKRKQAAAFPASIFSTGTASPSAPMSWTPNLPAILVDRHRALLRPLDAQD